MFKKSLLGSAIALAIALPNIAAAEVETSVILKNETAAFIKNGLRTGEATSMLDTKGDGRKIGKFENSAKIFFNGDVGEESSWHGELNLIYDAKATSRYKGHKNYTQNDWFRELYVDTNAGGWDLRIGKQQVVWGTADGIKLLDIINPTDYREMVQNTMEDSRIPVWMINAERNVGENGNIQFIVSQAEENKIPGLNSNGDAGHAFIMKGVDSITGRVNGFMNIAPALARVADSFDNGAQGGAFDTNDNGTGDPTPQGLTGFSGLTVDGFAANTQQLNADGSIRAGRTLGVASAPGAVILDNIAQNGLFAGDPNANNNVTNLVTPVFVVGPASDNTFEYMANATFATFNTFAANASHGSVVSQYVQKSPNNTKPNAGFRFRSSLGNGLNYSINYFYHYDSNPIIKTSWHDAVTGERLQTVLATSGDFNGDSNPDFVDPNGAAGGRTITAAEVPQNITVNAAGQATNAVSVLLRNAAGQYYGSVRPNPTLTLSSNGVVLRFTESQKRIHSFGASFDYGVDVSEIPVVLRGEFLYDKNSSQVVVDRKLLGIGDMVGGLTTRKADYFKYVLGGDITVMTNLLMSFQFIQFINLDFVNQKATCTTQSAAQRTTTNSFDCSRYTANPATMHLSNGLQKGRKTQEFYSFFLSRPFGESDLGRWNNIIMFEEGGGFWDRLDAEYSLSDELSVTGEVNMYWGSQNTMFGQFKNSSNIQVGLKYIIE